MIADERLREIELEAQGRKLNPRTHGEALDTLEVVHAFRNLRSEFEHASERVRELEEELTRAANAGFVGKVSHRFPPAKSGYLVAIETALQYAWPTSPEGAGLMPEAIEQVRAIAVAIQRASREIAWPTQVNVVWNTVDLALHGHDSEVAVDLSFQNGHGAVLHESRFRFPKKGITTFSAPKFAAMLRSDRVADSSSADE